MFIFGSSAVLVGVGVVFSTGGWDSDFGVEGGGDVGEGGGGGGVCVFVDEASATGSNVMLFDDIIYLY